MSQDKADPESILITADKNLLCKLIDAVINRTLKHYRENLKIQIPSFPEQERESLKTKFFKYLSKNGAVFEDASSTTTKTKTIMQSDVETQTSFNEIKREPSPSSPKTPTNNLPPTPQSQLIDNSTPPKSTKNLVQGNFSFKSKIPVLLNKLADPREKQLLFILRYFYEINFFDFADCRSVFSKIDFEDKLKVLEDTLYAKNYHNYKPAKSQQASKQEETRKLIEDLDFEQIEELCKLKIGEEQILKFIEIEENRIGELVDGSDKISSDSLIDYFRRKVHNFIELEVYPSLKCELSLTSCHNNVYVCDQKKADCMMSILTNLVDRLLLTKEMAVNIFELWLIESNVELLEMWLKNKVDDDFKNKYLEERARYPEYIAERKRFKLYGEEAREKIALTDFGKTNLGKFLQSNAPEQTTEEAMSKSELTQPEESQDKPSTSKKVESRRYNFDNISESIRKGDRNFFKYFYSQLGLPDIGADDSNHEQIDMKKFEKLSEIFEQNEFDDLKSDLNIVIQNIMAEKNLNEELENVSIGDDLPDNQN